jgi:hypothetical protein
MTTMTIPRSTSTETIRGTDAEKIGDWVVMLAAAELTTVSVLPSSFHVDVSLILSACGGYNFLKSSSRQEVVKNWQELVEAGCPRFGHRLA